MLNDYQISRPEKIGRPNNLALGKSFNSIQLWFCM
jgi:hypothetical protein